MRLLFLISATLIPASIATFCYQMESFGSKVNGCRRCREGYTFVQNSSLCDPHMECCRGLCCEGEDLITECKHPIIPYWVPSQQLTLDKENKRASK